MRSVQAVSRACHPVGAWAVACECGGMVPVRAGRRLPYRRSALPVRRGAPRRATSAAEALRASWRGGGALNGAARGLGAAVDGIAVTGCGVQAVVGGLWPS